MTEQNFQHEDREYERQRDHREELEREDIMSVAVKPWLGAVTPRRAPQPVDRDYAHRDARERHDAVSYAEIFGSAEIAAPVDQEEAA